MTPGGKAPRAAGDRHERGCVACLRGAGYLVQRSAGSFGPFDIWALRADTLPLLVNCKITDRTTSRERRQLHKTATEAGALALIASKPERGVIRWRRITDDGQTTPYDIRGPIWLNPS